MCAADLSDILREWPHDPKQNIRRIVSADGVEKLQVRLPLGIEQYELEGRPDGVRPEGHESYLEFFRDRVAEAQSPAALSQEDCQRLYEEGALYYFRYHLCFQLGDFDRVIRDTLRNLSMFDFTDRYASRDEDRVRVNQHRPYVLRMLASARALRHAAGDEFDQALRVLADAIAEIEQTAEVPTKTFRLEKQRSLAILRGMFREMKTKRPLPERERLQQRLKDAVAAENYEWAAELRDTLKRMDAG